MSQASDAIDARQSAIERLKELCPPGTTVYTVLRHVSRSGMCRGIDLYVLVHDGERTYPQWITTYVGAALKTPQSHRDWVRGRGLHVNGCGMDMGLYLVHNLGYALYGVDAGQSLNHEWI